MGEGRRSPTVEPLRSGEGLVVGLSAAVLSGVAIPEPVSAGAEQLVSVPTRAWYRQLGP